AAVGGTPTIVRCTRVSSRMKIEEDGAPNAGAFQGLVIQELTPQGFGRNAVGPTVTIAKPTAGEPGEPYWINGYTGDHPPNTVPIGNGGSGGQPVGPGGPATLGTAKAQVTSAGLATVINVTEWY
ncbi:MAG TPA: hypothetical protein VMQ76_08665, partial [Terracidiphilus sp.]|nr:hypothetical protein [Terracidiphilus sp.]